MTFEVLHNPAHSRFEAHVDGRLAVADYRREGDVLVMFHTEVPPQLQGRGIAAAMVESALAHARAHGLKIDPRCSYVRSYMQRHPDTLALHV